MPWTELNARTREWPMARAVAAAERDLGRQEQRGAGAAERAVKIGECGRCPGWEEGRRSLGVAEAQLGEDPGRSSQWRLAMEPAAGDVAGEARRGEA